MYLKSMFPAPPPIPHANVHELMFNTPSPVPTEDYTLHIDAVTGRKRSYQQFREVVRDGATALGTSPAEGGLGLSPQANDIVGIYSFNSMVRHLC